MDNALLSHPILPAPLPLFFYTISVVLFAISVTVAHDIEAEHTFVLALGGLLALSIAEVLRHRRRDPRWLADPCVLATILLFGVYYGISNIAYVVNPEFAEIFGDFPAMTEVTLLAGAACFAMWRGYDLRFPKTLAARLNRAIPQSLFRGQFALSWGWCISLLALSVVARLTLISLGVFGYSLEEERTRPLIEYLYVLNLFSTMGLVVLVAISLSAFSRAENSIRAFRWVGAVLLLEIVFGFLSGFKAQVVAPLLFVAACYVIARRRVPLVLMGVAAAVLLLAYLVIEPFRIARFQDPNFNPFDAVYLAAGLLRFFGEYADTRDDFLSTTASAILMRVSLTGVGAKGLIYANEVGLQPQDPDFLLLFVLFPALAFIPRLFWPGKPEETIAGWYTQVVLGRPDDLVTSIAMGPITSMYFAGGAIAVVLAFVALGALYRFIRELLLGDSSGKLLMYVVLLPVLVALENGMLHAMLVTLLRSIPLLLVLQLLLWSRATRASRSAKAVVH